MATGRSSLRMTTTDHSSTVGRDQRAVDEALGDSFKPSPSVPSTLEWAREGFDAAAALASSWKITLLGTIPSAAGQGLGSKMSQLVVDRAAEHGKGVWVWTTYDPRVSLALVAVRRSSE